MKNLTKDRNVFLKTTNNKKRNNKHILRPAHMSACEAKFSV